jgi:serine phosphatase RsbU (regulator of sigma subunit)
MQKSYFFISLITIFFFLNVSAQESNRLDSLLNELANKHTDSVRVDILNSMAWEFRNSDMDKVKLFSDSALQIAENISYYKGQVKSYFNTGNMYYIKGEYSLTLENYLKALSILEKIDDQKGIASALMGVGNIHAIQKNTDKAIEYQEKSLAIRLEINDSLGIAGSYNNLGSIYMDLKDYQKALEYHFKSLAIKESLSYWKGMSSSYGNIGVAYKELGKLSKSLEFQKKALEIREKLNNKKGMVMSYTDIGNIYHELKQYSKARINQKRALKIAKNISYKEGQVMSLLSLSITSEKLKKFKEALIYFKDYTNQKDSLFSIKKGKEIADMESVYTAEKQKQQIALLEKDNVIQTLKIKSQSEEISVAKSKQVAVFSVLILALCIVFFLIYSVVRRKKASKIIAEQKMIVELKNKEITDSITYAKRIQEAILPSTSQLNKHLINGFIFYQPKDIVAGDFYWMHSVGDTTLYAVADCTGHGVPGAMVSVVCHNALHRTVREHRLTDPAMILDKTREIVIETFDKGKREINDGMDIALCSVNFKEKKLYFSGANNPVYIIRNNELIEIKGNRQPIGKYTTITPFETHEIDLQEKDSVYIFSDGFADQFGGEKGKKFMYKSFRKLILSINDLSMDEQKLELKKVYNNWMGALEQVDDVCILGIKI